MRKQDIYRVLDRMEIIRIAKEENIVKKNKEIFKEQSYWYQLWT